MNLIIALLIAIVFELIFIWASTMTGMRKLIEAQQNAIKEVKDTVDDIQKRLQNKGTVADPFKLANSHRLPGASGGGIIKMKTPDQIRAEHYEEIKEGATYGRID